MVDATLFVYLGSAFFFLNEKNENERASRHHASTSDTPNREAIFVTSSEETCDGKVR